MKMPNTILAAAALFFVCGSAAQAQSLGFASFSAAIDRNGATTFGVGVQSSSRTRGGVYVIEFRRDLTSCIMVASVRERQVGFASVQHPVKGLPGNVVKVFTFSPAGAPTNLSFNLLVNCIS